MSSKGSVLVVMSGGVDSSVAAWLLLEQDYEVLGSHMRLVHLDGVEHGCCGPSARRDAAEAAKIAGFPFEIDLDGRELVDWRDAKIHVLSHAYYGSGVFEGISAYETRAAPGCGISTSTSSASSARPSSNTWTSRTHERRSPRPPRRSSGRTASTRATSVRSRSAATVRWASTRSTRR
jgi:sugar/nucleoside kinase (ribokinase family)